MEIPEIRQLAIGQWKKAKKTLEYSTFALCVDGRVYRYVPARDVWVALGTTVITQEAYKRRISAENRVAPEEEDK